jgi:hypothetical protein
MRYVVVGYAVVLGILFLYAVQLAWRRRRLTRAALRIESRPRDPGRAPGAAGRVDDR